MLFQKPPIFPLNPPSAHRRHPSAPPAVIVQPTRTPGLLSLTKPQRPSPHRHNHQPQQTNQQHRHSRTPKSKPVSRPDSLDSLNPPLAITEKKSSTLPHATPDKNARGRQQVKPAKDLTTRRSASHSSLTRTARRNSNRQPSPPVQTISQAEATPTQRSLPVSNLFDPFLVNSTSDSDSASDSNQPPVKPLALRPSPKLATYPTGKLARRRQPIPQPFPSPTPASKAVPVSRSSPMPRTPNISRSDPLSSHMPSRPINKRFTTEWDAFPICDDTTDDLTRPTTPVRSTPSFDNGPRTAPLSSTFAFPFGGQLTPSSSPSPSRNRTHQRTPSEGVFTMSFDDESTSHSPEELKALFSLFSNRQSPSSSAKVNKDKAGYFASSMFQNSPSPEELPPPSFGASA
jgi:hypothetical protein